MRLHTGLGYLNDLPIQEILEMVTDINEMEKEYGK